MKRAPLSMNEPPPGFGLIDGHEHPDSVVARVNYRRGIEDAVRVAKERSQTMANDDDLTRGYALGRQAAAAAILKLLPVAP